MVEQSRLHFDQEPQEPFQGEIITKDFLSAMRYAGQVALDVRASGLRAGIKSKNELVTQGDLAVTEVLKDRFSMQFPGCQFLDEETEETHGLAIPKRGALVIMDPIDGTTNYYNGGTANWGVSAGVMVDGQLVGGSIFQPETGLCYWAEAGKGAFVNGRRLSVSPTEDIHGSKLITCWPYEKDAEALALSHRVVDRVEQELRMQKIIFGSQVIEGMHVAKGERDAFMHFKTKPWDMAAAIAIVREAGGRATNAVGDPYDLFEDTIILSNGRMDLSPLTQIVREEQRAA